jgi:uncharacterized protein
VEYRKLPHGTEKESFSVLGLGLGGIQKSPEGEIERTIRCAIENGINFFDLCAGGKNVYAPFGRAIAGQRDKVFVQLHFGAVYNEKGEYAWSRDPDEIKLTFAWEMETLGMDYVDMGFLHCVDEDEDYDELVSSGMLNDLIALKKQGVVHHIGFSSHTPSVAHRILDMNLVDMLMFSINPAYDFEQGDAFGIGSGSERAELYRRCESMGVGISVMKAFHAGNLLNAKMSPLQHALTKAQCIQYALDRPGVLTVLPGVRGMRDLENLLTYVSASPEERDYFILGSFTAESVSGNCVYCNHCQPCPAGIDVGLVNKYYDLSLAGDRMAQSHYDKLAVKADACLKCGHCDDRCPFHVRQSERMGNIDYHFASGGL